MKTLFILRHAEAESDKGGGDHERGLTARGGHDAKALGEIMKAKGYVPALAMCSTARRTRETLEGVMQNLAIPVTEYHREIYHADVNGLLGFVRGFDDKYESVLIVGHNPTVHEIVAGLASDESEMLEKISAAYRPGTLSVFSCARGSWRDIQPGENQLIDVISI